MEEAGVELSVISSSLITCHRQQAVYLRKACKHYTSKNVNNNLLVVLSNLNMTVPKGAIYGLLGANGCGKTTLLGCIVGRKGLNSGEIWVLGGKPGSLSSGVPGPRIGYMPQEIALSPDFSICETAKYFGWINGMTTAKIEERLRFLSNLLILPTDDQLIKNLSAGQQRRVSLATTLLHEPELIILDEPTVGVDSLLRYNIWKYLTDFTKKCNRTIIFTTHCIEEANQAELIGLMRGGYFLAEESPESLMLRHGGASLENIFLRLSIKQNRTKEHRSNALEEISSTFVNEAADLNDEIDENSAISENIESIPPEEEFQVPFWDRIKVVKMRHVHALMWKNMLWFWKNLLLTILIILAPVFQFILFYLCFGHEPANLSISVVNHELNKAETCKPLLGCNSTRLSCNYLSYLNKTTMQLNYYGTEDEGTNAVRYGRAWASLIFPHNFSDAIRKRILIGNNAEEWDLDSSTVDVYQDNSNGNIGIYIRRNLNFAFEDFFQDYLTSCNLDSRVGKIPIKWEVSVYGSDIRNPDFTDFLSAGVIILIIFFSSVGLTACAIILERKDGIMERTLVNGINNNELIFSHLIICWSIMLIQSALLLVFSFAVFRFTQNGSYGIIIALMVTTGLCGISCGFLISCLCRDETAATYMTLGSFLPLLVLCGVLWPVEAMHKVLQIIAYILPVTKSTESMRAILSKGWDIDAPEVYAGFICNVTWSVIFLGVSLLLLRFKKS